MTQTLRNNLDTPLPDRPVIDRLTAIEFVRDLLTSETFELVTRSEIQGFESRILKRHLRKVIVSYTLRFEESTEKYIGLYREADERLRHSFLVMQTLRSNGFGEESELQVPEPILYVPALSFLMMEQAEGKHLREIFDHRKNLEFYARNTAKWLARLHDSSITLDDKFSQRDEIATTLKYTRAISWLFPTLSSKISSTGTALANLQGSLAAVERTPIHGDYHPRNIIATRHVTTAIDFEEARMGDPAFDIGYFVAQTKMTHGIGPTIIQAIEAFLQQYQESRSLTHTDLEKRVAIYEAQTYLQRIYHTYYLLELRPDFDLISKWMTTSLDCLKTAENRGSGIRGGNRE